MKSQKSEAAAWMSNRVDCLREVGRSARSDMLTHEPKDKSAPTREPLLIISC